MSEKFGLGLSDKAAEGVRGFFSVLDSGRNPGIDVEGFFLRHHDEFVPEPDRFLERFPGEKRIVNPVSAHARLLASQKPLPLNGSSGTMDQEVGLYMHDDAVRKAASGTEYLQFLKDRVAASRIEELVLNLDENVERFRLGSVEVYAANDPDAIQIVPDEVTLFLVPAALENPGNRGTARNASFVVAKFLERRKESGDDYVILPETGPKRQRLFFETYRYFPRGSENSILIRVSNYGRMSLDHKLTESCRITNISLPLPLIRT